MVNISYLNPDVYYLKNKITVYLLQVGSARKHPFLRKIHVGSEKYNNSMYSVSFFKELLTINLYVLNYVLPI